MPSWIERHNVFNQSVYQHMHLSQNLPMEVYDTGRIPDVLGEEHLLLLCTKACRGEHTTGFIY